MTEDVRGFSRRRLAGAAVGLGGALVMGARPGGAQAAGRGRTLRRGSAERAGLLPEHLDRLVDEARAFLGPSPDHPWYAGAVLLAGRGATVALHEAIGSAVRYAAYDEKSGTAVEFPPGARIEAAPDTVYDLASLSKLFTSLLAVQQIERGALRLDGTVASYLPEFAAAGKQGVTVRHLLTHTSGFPSWIPLYAAPTREERLKLVLNEAPTAPPGSAYLYSDLNLISLQLVLERITGRPLDALLHDEITAPLGMHRTRYNPPASWKPGIAATEDARRPWSGLDRGLVWGEVHDENAYCLGGAAGHAGVFSCAWDLAVLARTLLNGGAYGRARILSPASVDLLFTDFNAAFPGHEHGLGFELYQHWYMGAMATPRSAGHTGFTGTSLVLDPSTDTFLVVLANSVHPVRDWRSGSAPRVAAGNALARAVAVRPAHGGTSWFGGMARATSATLTLPELSVTDGRARLECALWWDTEPGVGVLALEASADAGAGWRPVPFTTVRAGEETVEHPAGSVTGWSGRVWHRTTADLAPWRGRPVRLRWRYTTGPLYVGRGVYTGGLRIVDGERAVFDESRPGDAGQVVSAGWVRSAD
ncbi:serine hydrolase [Streptomyces sp. NBC_00083]|uniref:serine hydrolase domain-containing protein n=1 Tax=Streptomyces sp. NBC_00083 TaxID=2975647 RepID=UPI002255E31F|nr:serine hydrolase domain-containing protein [Streptomyces sp. NBC_00083]MCX5383989.1 beta-lactamase family protein [Streptomyces sp. NBC_00083]